MARLYNGIVAPLPLQFVITAEDFREPAGGQNVFEQYRKALLKGGYHVTVARMIFTDDLTDFAGQYLRFQAAGFIVFHFSHRFGVGFVNLHCFGVDSFLSTGRKARGKVARTHYNHLDTKLLDFKS